jgi:hypothetical protein
MWKTENASLDHEFHGSPKHIQEGLLATQNPSAMPSIQLPRDWYQNTRHRGCLSYNEVFEDLVIRERTSLSDDDLIWKSTRCRMGGLVIAVFSCSLITDATLSGDLVIGGTTVGGYVVCWIRGWQTRYRSRVLAWSVSSYVLFLHPRPRKSGLLWS